MTTDQKRRQKKLAKKSAKRKAKQHTIAKKSSLGLAAQLHQASTAPILHCYVQGLSSDQGMSQVLISRQLSGGRVAFAIFLIDNFCLGVKNALGQIVAKVPYEDRYLSPILDQDDVRQVEPAAALKLVTDAIEFAREHGFQPHADCDRVMPIFGDVDASQCDMEFEFGRGGQPFFISGPHDSPEKCRRIISMLHDRYGPGGYDYLISSLSLSGLANVLESSDDGDKLDENDWGD